MTSSSPQKPNGAWIIAGLVVLLLIMHQDNWYWTDDTLVFGFMPIGMFWHVLISIGASLTWALATVIAWPVQDDEFDPPTIGESGNRDSGNRDSGTEEARS